MSMTPCSLGGELSATLPVLCKARRCVDYVGAKLIVACYRYVCTDGVTRIRYHEVARQDGIVTS